MIFKIKFRLVNILHMGQDQSVPDGGGSASAKDPRMRTQQKQAVGQIVVVSEKAEDKTDGIRNDEDIQLLMGTRVSKPILKNTSASETEFVRLPRILSGPLTEMILRYQFHLTECAEAVAFDQSALSKQMKETDALASKVNKIMNDRHKSIDKAMAQVQTVHDVLNVVRQIETNLSSCIELFRTVNRKFPMEDQIHDPEFR